MRKLFQLDLFLVDFPPQSSCSPAHPVTGHEKNTERQDHCHPWSRHGVPQAIESLFVAGADVFRLNASHGTHDEHRERIFAIRAIERKLRRPIGVLFDLQGPKLRVGNFRDGKAQLHPGPNFASICRTSLAMNAGLPFRTPRFSPRCPSAPSFC